MSVYQHWDKLKTCLLGKSYPPEFYSWIKDTRARNAMERVAIETEEDFIKIKTKLETLGVDVIRPEVSADHNQYYIPELNKYAPPPITPRDHSGTFGDRFIIDSPIQKTIRDYYAVSDPSWPECKSFEDIRNLDDWILNELRDIHGLDTNKYHEQRIILQSFYDVLDENNIDYELNSSPVQMNTADVCRVGNYLIYPNNRINNANPVIGKKLTEMVKNNFGQQYRIGFYHEEGHSDGVFCPVVPGLIIALNGYLEYEQSFPNWEVVELPSKQSWMEIQKFIKLKHSNQGKWWVPGEENNHAFTNTVEEWLDNWVGYVEETVFDVNMLVVDEKNVICNNENDKVFEALERYGVTPHVCNFRHRFFWDGGIHCITADIERDGEMKDYFPKLS